MPRKTDLKLEIDYPNEKAGWIHCYLTFNGERHHLWASGAFSPFPQIMEFLRSLLTQRLPSKFFWDEEGVGAHFEAWSIAPDNPMFRFRVVYDQTETWVDAELDRQEVITEFLETLRDFAKHVCPSRGDWHLNLSDIQAFDELRKQEIALRTNITAAEAIRFKLQRAKDLMIPVQWMYFWVTDLTPQIVCVLKDTDQFWLNWFELLEKVMLGQLPAEVKYVNIDWLKMVQEQIATGEITSVEPDRQFGMVFRAEPLSHPGHFRFIVRETDFDYEDFLLVDEVLRVPQFVSEFYNVFEDFLETSYQMIQADDGSQFDLRTLPLDSLRALLKKRIE